MPDRAVREARARTCGLVVRAFSLSLALDRCSARASRTSLKRRVSLCWRPAKSSVPTPAARELLADPSRVLNGLLQDMHSSGVAADVNFLNGALRVYVGALDNFQTLNRSASAFGKHPADRLHLASLAWELFSTATEGSSLHGAIAPNNVTYNLLIRIFCGANEFERCVNCPYLYSVPRIVGFS